MESQYFRTFIAAPIRVDKRFLLSRRHLMEALREERISWTNPGQYHVTLRFIGDTKLSEVSLIKDALQNEVSVPLRTYLETNGLASFGPRKRPRVIWVGFKDNNFIDSLKLEVDRVLEKCGITINDQPFRAHLTLGRIRSLDKLQNYYSTIDEMAPEFNSAVAFDRLVFFRSILSPRGPEYHSLKEIQLGQ